MIWIMTFFPAVLLLLGFPIYLTLLSTCSVVLVFFYPIPATAIPSVMFGALDNSAILAVPFFILAGEIMAAGGISRRLVNWSGSLFGSARSSLPITTVATCVVFGAISGSSAATVASVGRITFKPMVEAGYNVRFATGLLTASGLIGNLIPPGIAMILFAAVAEESVVDLFSAGIVPGLVFALTFVGYILLRRKESTVDRPEPFRLTRLARESGRAAWAFGLPVIILGGIYSGTITATESAGIACIYAILVSLFVHCEVTLGDVGRIGQRAAFITAQVMVLLASAGVYSWLLVTSGAGPAVTNLFAAWDLPPWALLMVINILLLMVGTFLDPPPAILLLTPLLMPVVRDAGIDPIHFGVIMVTNLSIGTFTPPFGVNIFVAQAAFRQPIGTVYRGVVPFILLSILVLALVTYVPVLSLGILRWL